MMSVDSIQNEVSIARVLCRAFTATVLFAIAPLGLAQQVLTPATINFGNVPLTVPVTQTGTFTNNSTFQSVTITALTTSDARFVAAGSGGAPCNVGAVLSFGANCTYALTFTPTGTGTFNNTTSVAYNLVAVPQPPLTQASSGTGFIPPSTIAPASILFGNVPLTVISNQTFTFTNNSNTTLFPAPYTLTSFSTTGLGFSAVGSGGTPCAVGLVLPPAASCQGTASFQIGGTGSSNGTTTIGFQTGQGANPVFNMSVPLNGTGFVPPSTLSPSSISFGGVIVGVPATQSFSYTNNSDLTAFPSTYTVTNLSTTGLGYSAVGSGANPCVINLMLVAGASCGVTVTFVPAGTGASGGSADIDFLAGLGTNPPYSRSVSLSGTGLPAPAVTIAGSGTFPNTTLGQSSAVQSITITNSGGATLTLNSITHSNASVFPDTTGGPAPNAAHWCGFGSAAGGAPNTGSPINIAPGGTCVLNLIFAPNATGALSGTIIINSTAPTSPTTISLSGTGLAPPPPTMTVSFAPTSVLPGVNSTLNLTLTNPNATPAFISSGSITIPAGLTATPPGTNTCGTFGSVGGGVYSFGMGNIPASGSCTINLTVQSATPGTYTATIVPGALSAGGSNTNTSSAALTVTALAVPTITFAITPTTITVGGTTVGTMTITNSNVVPLTAAPFTFFYLPGLVNAPTPNATSTCAGASITATPGTGSYNETTSFTIPASGSCTFSSTVTTSTTGTYTGAIPAGLIMTAAGSSAASNSVTLIVTAIPTPAVTLTPPAINFGARTVNTTSPVQIATLTNSGTAPLIISGISGSGDFGFTTTCPISSPPISAAGTCTISVTFTPLTVAALTGSISITSNAPGSPTTIALSGTGSAVAVPAVSLSAATLNFGSQPINTATAVQSVAVTNTGFATLLISGITKTGSSAFSRVSPASPSPDCATSLAPGATCYLSVVYTPTAIGADTAQISIASNAGGSPNFVNLTGSGIAAAIPAISVPGSIGFGDQVITTSTAQSLTISSAGSTALNVSGITLSGTDAASFATSGTCTVIAVGASCAITITFTPTSVGAKSAQLTIASNASGQPSTLVTLSGNGILAPRPIVELSVTAIGYGNAIFGGATASQVVTLRNTGGVALNIQNLFTSGDFVLMSSCPGSLPSGAACVINVSFSPLGIGYRTGELVLVDNAPGSPHRIPLSGTGCRWFSPAQSRLFLTVCGN